MKLRQKQTITHVHSLMKHHQMYVNSIGSCQCRVRIDVLPDRCFKIEQNRDDAQFHANRRQSIADRLNRTFIRVKRNETKTKTKTNAKNVQKNNLYLLKKANGQTSDVTRQLFCIRFEKMFCFIDLNR
jgi:hypothetical protein